MADVHLRFINNVNMQVVCEPSIIMELADKLTWKAANYKFHTKYKARMWDGNITKINRMSGVVNVGLAQVIKKFCDKSGYTVSFDEELTYASVSEHELTEFIKTLNIPEKFAIRDYQFTSILKCIRSGRRTLLSPTSSGKSLMIYIITQWYKEHKNLVIVPTIGLVTQLEKDFIDYGYTGTIHKSTKGLSRDNNIPADIVITTWQSLDNGKSRMPLQWYSQFGAVFGDEAHGCKAASLIKILESLVNCRFRFGTTGTLDDDPLNEHTIIGLFGPKYQAITTKEMIDQGYASKLKIKCIVLKYDEATCKKFVPKPKDKDGKKHPDNIEYPDEIDFLVNCNSRNVFIKNLTLSLKGNKLVFFKIIDHGKMLYDLIAETSTDKVFHIDGAVSGDNRETIRKAIELEENSTLVASLGTTSTGISINRLHHMIAASPSKGKIKVLQSIGRMLRLHEEKQDTGAVLYDIVDDLSYKTHQNFTLKHFVERCKIYDAEQFDYQIYNVKVKA